MTDDETRLDELIRAVRRQHGDEETSLPDGVVHAYLVGRASAEEKSAVRHALTRSPELRRELIELSHHLEKLSTSEAAAAFDAAAAPPAPTHILSQFGRTSEGTASGDRQRGESLAERVVAAFRSLFEVPRVFATVPAAAAVAVVLSVVPRLSWLPSASLLTTQYFASRSFVSAPTGARGGAGTHEAAAEDQVRRCIRLDGGQLMLVAHPSAPELERRVATVHFVNAWRRKLHSIELFGAAPAAGVQNRANVRVWLAILPQVDGGDVELRVYPLQGTSAAIRGDAERRTRGAVFATFESSQEVFDATHCVPVEFGSD